MLLLCLVVFLQVLILRTNQQSHKHSHTHILMYQHGRPGWLGRQDQSIRAVGLLWDYMKAREITTSVWSLETKLIYCRTQHRSLDLAEHHLRLPERKMRVKHSPFTFSRFTTTASGRALVPGRLHKALALLGATNELMQRKSLTCIRHPRSTERN